MLDTPNSDAPPEPRLPSWTTSTLVAWLADHRGHSRPTIQLFNELCQRLVAEGIPLWRANVSLNDHHPEVAARSIVWKVDEAPQETAFPQSARLSEQYFQSPIKQIHGGVSKVRRRLDVPGAQLDFPILTEFQDQGATDYVALPLAFSDGSRHFISWVTKQPGGFTDVELRRLGDLMPLICLRIELEHSYTVRRQLLTTYLGRRAAQRVIGGTIRRNQVEAIEAVILYCDLRDFSALTDRFGADTVVTLLAEYYGAVVPPIEDNGGDVIKMIGDGLLAIFPIDQTLDPIFRDVIACEAVAAAKRGLERLAEIPQDRLPEGAGPLKAGVALHCGTVTFGNVGAEDRLDFTVIGPAVNEAHRVEELTKTLRHPILTTAAFATLRCSVRLGSLGYFNLRGISEPKEVFRILE